MIVGVDPTKAVGRKPSIQSVEAITKANSEDQFEAREAIYDQYRMELQYHFRYLME